MDKEILRVWTKLYDTWLDAQEADGDDIKRMDAYNNLVAFESEHELKRN
jgi:hypothetical protein